MIVKEEYDVRFERLNSDEPTASVLDGPQNSEKAFKCSPVRSLRSCSNQLGSFLSFSFKFMDI